ncbi:MAG: ComEC/Rec2 family competence protein, partial [Bacteroidota bacterium]
FIVIAQTSKYHTNIFNTLSVSCFALLLYNPYLIMEVGFQLSFLAVLGIVSIQPWIYEKWQPKTWLMNQIWIITSVSLGAQIATFPLGLLYFHQFPNYFLFSNLIVIPVSTVILGYGILMFALGKISAIGAICGKGFSYTVWFLNESVKVVDKTPGALIQGISTSIFETWIIYVLTIFLMLYIYKKHLRFLFISLTTCILLLSLQTAESYSIKKQKAIIIYNVPKISGYDFVSGNNTIFLADSSLIHNSNRMLFHIKHNWWERSVTNQHQIENNKTIIYSDENINIKNNFIQFGSKRIAIVDSLPRIKSSLTTKLKVDLIILSKNPKIKISDLQKWLEFKKIIIDSSNSEWRNENWKKECENLKINFYSVIDSGAYVEGLL